MPKRTLCLVCAVLVVLALAGCRKKHERPVIVNVLRDLDSRFDKKFERELLDFQAREPRTSSGKLIIVQSIMLPRSQFGQMLADGTALSTFTPDLVILDSEDQLHASARVAREAMHAVNVCGSQATCPVFIPSWVSGDKLDAARQVLQALLSSGG